MLAMGPEWLELLRWREEDGFEMHLAGKGDERGDVRNVHSERKGKTGHDVSVFRSATGLMK